MKTKLIALASLVIPAMLLFACKKGEDKVSHLSVRMMDAPSPYAFEQVNVDVREVEAHIETRDGGEWVRLEAESGVYNLLTLTNGLDTMIGQNIVPVGRLSQLRLVLGSENSVKVNGTLYPLFVPSGSTSGLKINVHQEISENRPVVIFLDFDAAQSVSLNNNGYRFHPVVRGFTAAGTGNVQGRVNIPGPGIAVTLSNGTSLYSTYTNQLTGHFLLRGVQSGEYTLKVYPKDTDIPIVVTGIQVTAGSTTDAGLVLLE